VFRTWWKINWKELEAWSLANFSFVILFSIALLTGGWCPNSIDSWTTKIKQTLNSYTIRHLNTYDKTTKQPIGHNQHIRKHPIYNNFALTKRSSSSCHPPPPTKTVQPIQLKTRLLLSLPILAIYYIMASETATRSHHLRNQQFQNDDESKLFSTKPLVQIFSLESFLIHKKQTSFSITFHFPIILALLLFTTQTKK
jgi:hypothetical protein